MAEKLRDYQGCVGRLHELRSKISERISLWKQEKRGGLVEFIKFHVFNVNYQQSEGEKYEDFSHIYRKKSRRELVRISAAVMGIEFSYAAETAFVSPTLLKIGVEHKHMTFIWALSPLIGFFLTPVLGSLSDRCRSTVGRRRPFIFFMSLGVLLGLILVPNGESLGYAFGDEKPLNSTVGSGTKSDNFKGREDDTENPAYTGDGISVNSNISESETYFRNSHPWGVIITVIGTVLLDFDADACQSPARAYLLDVTVPDDHARGLSTFTTMAGLGGFLGYALGGINWDATILGDVLGGHVKAVFTFITIIFVVCVTYTITSFKEVPLSILEAELVEDNERHDKESDGKRENNASDYGSMERQENVSRGPIGKYSVLGEPTESFDDADAPGITPEPDVNVKASTLLYLKSILAMPRSMKTLCLTNLFCWMAHVCYSLYFTDFVGEAVFEGNPVAMEGSSSRKLYESGVRFGCWGMSMYSLSCACYSVNIESYINRYGAKRVYVGGLLTYSLGMCLMALTKNKFGVILFSWTAGVMYSTLFTMPYLIVARYHALGTFGVSEDGAAVTSTEIRGLGTDIAVISSMVFLAQFVLSICMGPIVSAANTTAAVVGVASVLALLGAISASQVTYLDL